MSARALHRWRLTLPLALPALGGLAYLLAFGAPARLPAVNAGALLLALVWVMWGRFPSGAKARCGLAAGFASLLFLPLLTGPEAGGVCRWLPLGRVLMLHSGALLLPLLTVLAAGMPRRGPWLLALAALALALQPDAGSLAALAAAAAALAAMHRSKGFALVGGAGVILMLARWNAGTLAPQLHTEGVLAQVAGTSPLFALALAGALFAAPVWLLRRDPHMPRAEGYALAALMAGSGLAAMLGPFPFPLIGYGASPILGFGLALGALPRAESARERFQAAS